MVSSQDEVHCGLHAFVGSNPKTWELTTSKTTSEHWNGAVELESATAWKAEASSSASVFWTAETHSVWQVPEQELWSFSLRGLCTEPSPGSPALGHGQPASASAQAARHGVKLLPSTRDSHLCPVLELERQEAEDTKSSLSWSPPPPSVRGCGLILELALCWGEHWAHVPDLPLGRVLSFQSENLPSNSIKSRAEPLEINQIIN